MTSPIRPLRCQDPDLRDLAAGSPELHDAVRGEATGARLVRLLGVGGMSAVFLADVDVRRERARAGALALNCPSRLAVKIMKPAATHSLAQEGVDPRKLADREAEVLGRLMARAPPTDVVVGLYGRGDLQIEMHGRAHAVPWLALELVDGGPDGPSLSERIRRALGGCDPVRAHRLIRRIAEGVAILHEHQVVHRDLKPDNVLVAGPVGDETPKIADCGISRCEGAAYTIAALTREYAAPEQWLSRPGTRNPLIGPWTDVHALAAVMWFVIAGDHWCRGPSDAEFLVYGARRSLRTGERLHPGFAAERALLDEIDAVLARGASPMLPEHVRGNVPALAPKSAPPRLSSVAELMERLVPPLAEIERRWRARAAREGVAKTVFRSTQLVGEAETVEPLASYIEVAPLPQATRPPTPLAPGNVAFQADGRALARFGDRLFYLLDDGRLPIPVPVDGHEPRVAATTHVVRAPFGGFALVGPEHIVIVRPGRVKSAPLPARADGRAVGPIEAVVGDAHAFGVVTADVGEGGPELWLRAGEDAWVDALVLPGALRVNAVASSPYGFLAVGEVHTPHGGRARAVFASEEGQPSVYIKGLSDKPPLHAALSSSERLAWAAGDGFVLALDRGNVASEAVEARDRPVAMALDPVGVPWLVTTGAVMRRSVQGGAPSWRTYHEKDDDAPPFVGVGFSPLGVRVVDARGGGVLIEPRDVDSWRDTSSLFPASVTSRETSTAGAHRGGG